MASTIRPTGMEIDETRAKQIAYQYLCHLEEVKLWLETVLKLELPPAAVLEDKLRNGVILAKLGHFVTPEVVPLGSIYDSGEKRYEAMGLSFRHTENINLWLRAVQRSGFPRTFLPEVPDIFEGKNIPKLIYCLHALSAHLFRLGIAPPIHDLYGKIQFADTTIQNVCASLKESGTEMPAFQKIGGLLVTDVDKNKMLNTVAAVNVAVDQKSAQNLMIALTDPLLSISNVKKEYKDEYLHVLTSAKAEKTESSFNKSLNGSFEVDSESELLLLPEIQGYVKTVNANMLWDHITKCIEAKDTSNIRQALVDHRDTLGEVFVHDNIEFYIEELDQINIDQVENPRDFLLKKLEGANQRALKSRRAEKVIEELVSVLQCESLSKLVAILLEPSLDVWSLVDPSAAQLYLSELQDHFAMTQKLTMSDVKSCIIAMNYVAGVTKAVDSKDADSSWNALCDMNEKLGGILELPNTADRSARMQYFGCLEKAREWGLDQGFTVLNLEEIQFCIEKVNAREIKKQEELEGVNHVNGSILMGDKVTMMKLLKKFLPTLEESDSALCFCLLTHRLKERHSVGQDIWLSDITSLPEDIAMYHHAAEHVILLLRDIETAVIEDDHVTLVEMLAAEGVSCPVPAQKLLTALNDLQKRCDTDEKSGLVEEQVSGLAVYIDIDAGNYFFERPLGASVTSQRVTIKLIKDAINRLAKEGNDEMEKVVNQAIVNIQAYVRGMLVRKKLAKWKTSAVVIQRWWRNLRECTDGDLIMAYYRQHENEIKKIQDCWRNRQKRKASGQITPEPPEVRKKLSNECTIQTSNLAESKADNSSIYNATDDLIQKLRRQVVESVKRNQDLAKKVDDMDVKIGLLIRNRISVASLLSERKKGKVVAANELKGLKALSKEARTLLDGYQKLFYLLQTRPGYLSRLICTAPSNLTIQSCIFNLFSHGSSPRDEYLLLRLFAHALNNEVETKFQAPSDAVKGNPLVLKLALGFARQGVGQHPLKYILAPLILKVLDETTALDTNPVDIYRRWINETEANSGCQSSLPRCVSQDVALQYPDVVRRIDINIKLLQMWVKKFLTRLVDNTHRLPYALKFIAKILKEALQRKFPQLVEKDVLKIVGHLIYYQFINSALVAPDAFHVISLPAERPMRSEQRKNLATIAKILQFSASKTGFGEESRHLQKLNPFIIECHEIMKQMSQECCAVPSLEDHYHFNEFSEAVLMRRPTVYMTTAEICEAHQLLLERKDSIAPEPADPIHDILFDLGTVPTPAALLGYSKEAAANISCERVLICLDLNNEYLAEDEERKPMGDTDSEAERKLRREAQTKELSDIKLTLSRLEEKTKHFEEQLACYEKYLDTCLKSHITTKKSKPVKSYRYTGAQLMEKGVLVALDSVPSNQHKNLQFEISSTPDSGVFQVKCRFMGVDVDSTQIDIQHLLSLQYEGCGVMNMFGKAEINVNLLLFLLNKKFVGLHSKKSSVKPGK